MPHSPLDRHSASINIVSTECRDDLQTRTPVRKAGPFRTALPQVLATMAQSLLLLALGMMVAVPTIVVAALHNASTLPSLDDQQASWFAGILLICQPIGSVLSGVLQDTLGRKRCMLLVNLPQLLGWYLLYSTASLASLYSAALALGFSIGFMEAPTLSYVGEICQPRLRGTLASFTSVYVSSGHFLMYLLGTIAYWRTAMAIAAAVPIISVIAILQVPESPIWLLMKGRRDDAERALCWLRGWVTPAHVSEEMRALIKYSEASKLKIVTRESRSSIYIPVPTEANGNGDEGSSNQVDDVPITRKPTLVERLRDLTRPEMIRPLRLVILFFFFYHCASMSGIRPYMIHVFNSLGLPMDPHWVAVLSASLQVSGSFTCMAILHKFGKRSVAMFSMLCCALCCVSLGIYKLLQQTHNVNYSWIPLLLVSALFYFGNVGISPIPWSLLAEVFPSRGRGIGGGISAASYYVLFFLVSKTFLDLEHCFQLYGVFFLYGALGFVGLVFLYFCLPETEGKKLDEIEKYFKNVTKSG